MSAEATEYQFLWYLENYSYIALNCSWLFSPKFIAERHERTSWCLELNPLNLRQKSYESLFLRRSGDDAGPESHSVSLEISIITVDGSTLYSKYCEDNFRKGERHYFKALVDMDELIERKNVDFLPQDTLGVLCRMWRGEGSTQKVKKYTARTLIGIEKISFLHSVENFSSLEKIETKRLLVPSRLKCGCIFSSTLVINTDGSIIADFKSTGFRHRLKRKQIFLLDIKGKTRKCGEVDYRFTDCDEKEEEEMLKSFTRDFILNKKTIYLPKDELTLLCEYTCYVGTELSKIDEVEMPIEICKDRHCNTNKRNDCKSAEVSAKTTASGNVKFSTKRLPSYPSVIDDLKALYNDQLLTDVKLKTATKSFPAHKNVLCARSSVFRSMLSHDMKERNTDCIKVDDLEDETVHQFLLFLYSDSLENLQWETAIKLYYAADKYEVKSLKILCFSFLVDNLSTSSASELLVLADTHSDKDLRELVEDFILEHDKEVFRSDEWKKLSKTNPWLVNETMLLKYNRDESDK